MTAAPIPARIPAPSPDMEDWTATERQAAAREAYLASVADGTPLTGAELGRRFGRTDRWGRMQISKVRSEARGAKATGNNGRRPVSVPATRDHAGRSRDSRETGRDRVSAFRHAQTPAAPHNGSVTFRKGSGDPAGNGERKADADESQSWLDSAITLVVALVAAAASYGHMLDVALMAGEPAWIARAFPITVDGLVLAALRRGHKGRGWLALGAAVSVAANVLAQFPEHAAAAGPIVSAWPPLALYGTHRLLHR